jgi:prophage maintenance system killer protein
LASPSFEASQNPTTAPRFITSVAFGATYTFLAINGMRITADAEAAFDFIAGLYDANDFTFESLATWLRANVAPG